MHVSWAELEANRRYQEAHEKLITKDCFAPLLSKLLIMEKDLDNFIIVLGKPFIERQQYLRDLGKLIQEKVDQPPLVTPNPKPFSDEYSLYEQLDLMN